MNRAGPERQRDASMWAKCYRSTAHRARAARAALATVPVLAVLAVAPVLGLGATVLPTEPASAAAACNGSINGITAYAGSGQVAKVDTAYSTPLQAEVVDQGGCPVTGADVEFTVPDSGAGGFFPGDVITVTVPTGTNGIATAPTLTANEVSGSFTVQASISDYSAGFQLTNTTVGAISSITASSGSGQSAAIAGTFAEPLEVSVIDSYGDPIGDTTVNFTVVTDAGAGATFAGGGATATAQTDGAGVAVSPTLTAGDTVGPFTVTATVTGTTSMATFSLTDLAGAPDAIAAGVGSSQSTELGADFAVPLAVTVTDADGNPVEGAVVVFTAPGSGASGVFAGSGTTADVLANADGVATAPDFSANDHTGGYVVTAKVAGLVTPATFALVNEPRTGASAPGPNGSYWLVTSTGQVLRSGGAPDYGSVAAKKLASPVVGIAATPDEGGYWLVTSKGVVYAFGDAVNYGSPAKVHLAKPIVGIASTPDGKGYWLVASDGGIFNYGDAVSYGSPAKVHLAKPIVGIASTPDGKGYWLVASDGGIFNYGDAKYYGSPAKVHLAKPIVAIASTPDGKGYWLVSANGTIRGYGDGINFGAGISLSPQPVRTLVRTDDGAGYWVVSANGTAAGFGDAGAQGSTMSAAKTVVAGAV